MIRIEALGGGGVGWVRLAARGQGAYEDDVLDIFEGHVSGCM